MSASAHGDEPVSSSDRQPRRLVLTASAALDATAHGRPAAGWRTFLSRLLHVGVAPYLVAIDAVLLTATVVLTPGPTALQAGSAVLMLVLFAAGGLYWPRLTLSALDDLPALVGRALVATGCTASVAVLGLDRPEETRTLLFQALVAAGLIVPGRAISYAIVRAVRRHGTVRHCTLVLGAGRVGGMFAQTLLDHPEYGLAPIGFLDDDPLLAESERPLPVLGPTSAVAETVLGHDVKVVVMAFSSVRENRLVQALRTCDRLDCDVFLVPRLFELNYRSRDMDVVWGLPLVRLRRPAFRVGARVAKRSLDLALSAAALVLLSPVLVACALATLLSIGRPLLFMQERVGVDGRTFRMAKFRTLLPVSADESGTRWNVAHDERLGRVGRLLRRTSLDELPQLWNVLRGDMSLVGPRPERPYFVHEFAQVYPHYLARHRVPAGLTGWAQVHGLRGDTSIRDRAVFDNYYIENYSLWNDIKILLRTILAIGRGAR